MTVIKFPTKETLEGKKNEPSSEINVHSSNSIYTDIEEAIDATVYSMFLTLKMKGYDFSNDSGIYAKDVMMIVETIRSLLLKKNGKYHDIQEIVERLMEVQNDPDKGIFIKTNLYKLDVNEGASF